MAAPIVFFDIAGPEGPAQQRSYASVFDWEIAADGSFSIAVTPSLHGTLRQDPAEKRFYLGVEDINATLAAVQMHGGTVDAPRFEVPGVVVLGLFRDPAGNPMGLVEMAEGIAKVP
jgi:predicted enzyme related to lactoylglutathione lyase